MTVQYPVYHSLPGKRRGDSLDLPFSSKSIEWAEGKETKDYLSGTLLGSLFTGGPGKPLSLVGMLG